MMLAAMVRLQAQLVLTLYKRAPADTFPVTYRANTAETLEKLAVASGMRLYELTFVEDPTYLAWSNAALVITAIIGLILPAGRQIHLVGEFKKPKQGP